MTVAKSLPAQARYEPGLGSRNYAASSEPHAIEVSVVLPCLNEEASVAACVAAIQDALDPLGVSYEVIVVDNGSSDASAARAGAAGARVVHEPVAGYGSACRAGLDAARGRYLAWGDADGTYDFSSLPDLIALLNGHDVVIGNRLAGAIEPGAMPWTHRRIGTPFLTGVVNTLFGAEIGDINCGIRAISRAAYSRLDPGTNGMEFASEMVVKAVQLELSIAQIPVAYRRRHSGEVKLRTWSDGWRHLRLVVGSWVSHRRVSVTAAPVVVLDGGSDVTVDLTMAEEPDADRLRL